MQMMPCLIKMNSFKIGQLALEVSLAPRGNHIVQVSCLLLIFHVNDGHRIAAVACKQLCHVVQTKQDGCLYAWEHVVVHEDGGWRYRRPSSRGVFHSCLEPESPFRNALCQVATEEGAETNYHSRTAIIIIREAAEPPSSPALIPISTETEGESGPFVSEMFIYATDLPKDMEKPLLQVMTVESQHMIHLTCYGEILLKSTPCCKTWSLFNYARAVFETVFFF